MDFKDIPVSAQPAYTWLWNTKVTQEGVRQRIDEMNNLGIRAFYILGEPEKFRPTTRRTHLYIVPMMRIFPASEPIMHLRETLKYSLSLLTKSLKSVLGMLWAPTLNRCLTMKPA